MGISEFGRVRVWFRDLWIFYTQMILGGITSLTVGIKLGALWSTQTVRKKDEGGSCIRYNRGIL